MKKSPAKIIELFVYIIILILAIAWTFKGGNKSNDFSINHDVKQEKQIHQSDDVSEYKLPPKNEFRLNP